MSEWINVKNQLPLDSKNVLIYSKNQGVGYGWYTTEEGWYYCYNYDNEFIHISENDITHWMPLPESPNPNEKIIMEDLFRYEVDFGSGGYGFTDTFDELIEDVNNAFYEDIAEEIKEWALKSKKGDEYKKIWGIYFKCGKKS